MPVNTSSSTKQSAGDGTQTTFPFTFPISDETDLVVKERIDATGVTTTKTLTTHYTVVKSGANFDDGGNVEMGTAPASGVTLVVTRATTQTQTMDLIYGAAPDSEAIEDAVDKNTRMIQELQTQVDRCFKIPDSDAETADMETANSVDRASQYSGFDASGNLIAAAAFASHGAASAYIQTLLDDATAVIACDTLLTNKFDLIVNSVADLELLKAGAGGSYPRVYIVHGSYSTAEQLDFDENGVEYLCGERRDTTIVMTNAAAAGALITLKDDSIIERLTVQHTGAINQTAVSIVQSKTTNNSTVCRNVTVFGSGDGDGDGLGFDDIAYNITTYGTGGLYGCYSYDNYRGFNACNNLTACRAYSNAHDGYSSCYGVTNCSSNGNTGDGFSGVRMGSGLFSTKNGAWGFATCYRLSSCESDDDTSGGYNQCNMVSACLAKDSDVDGFNSCDNVSACEAQGSAGKGFASCNYMSACKSGTSTGVDYDTCSYMSACKADATGAGSWNACATEIDEDSCNMT